MHTNQFLSKNDENSQFLLISRRESNKVPAAGQQFCLSRPAIRKKHYDTERENPTSQRRTQNLDFERPQNNSAKSKNKQQQHALRYRKPPKKKLIKKILKA